MLYLRSCNQSVACKCRNWNMLRPNILDNKSMERCKIPEFWELQICIDVTVLLHSIWELLSNTLFAFTFDYMHFFQFLPLSSSFFHFLPEETGRNTFFPVSSILPGRNLFLPEVSEPWNYMSRDPNSWKISTAILVKLMYVGCNTCQRL